MNSNVIQGIGYIGKAVEEACLNQNVANTIADLLKALSLFGVTVPTVQLPEPKK